jgi:hypothetical protein
MPPAGTSLVWFVFRLRTTAPVTLVSGAARGSSRSTLSHRNAILGFLKRALLHDLRRPEGVAAVYDRHLLRELGEEGGLLHRGVAAAHDQDLLALVEEPSQVAQAETPPMRVRNSSSSGRPSQRARAPWR